MHRSNLIRRALLLAVVACLAFGDTLQGFTVPIHRAITRSELEAATAVVAGEERHFSERAVEEVMDANESMDDGLSQALFRPERHFTNEEFRDSTRRLRDLRQRVIDSVTASRPNGSRARQALGHALHLIQDFYSHSNWVELGGGVIDDFGQTVYADPAVATNPCPADPNVLGAGGGGDPTSAYFVGVTLNRDTFGCVESSLPDPGKCFHGNYTLTCVGINKDNDTVVNGVPVSPFHGAARSVAEQATTTFLQGILDELAGNDEALAALLDLRGTIGFVVDDTGSMGPEISGVRSSISRVVNLLAGSPERKPDEWLLERFGDPDVGTPFVTPDASALLAAANALRASGGGDCPELSQTGLLRSVEAALPQSTLFFYSDASAKDSGLARTVVRRAQDKRTRIIYALTGSCSPIDPAYVLGAAETGGQLFVLASSEIDDLFALIEPQLTGDVATVLRRSGSFAGTPVTDTFPVDGTMTTLLVSVTSDVKGPVVVRRPSGAVADAADPDVERLELSGGTLVRIDAPEIGAWSVELSGGGAWTLLAQGNTPLELYEVDFVEENDDIHGGYFAIAGEPIAEEDAIVEATLLGPYLTGAFELVDQNGLPLAPVDLAQGFPGEDPENFLGELVPPNVPFRVVATGSDQDGNAYRREFPKVFRAQTVRVELEDMDDDTIVPGGSVGLDFEVTNLGAGGTFALRATDSLGRTVGLPSGSLFLATDESAPVVFDYVLPASAVDLEEVSVTLTATRTDDPDVFNSDVAELEVSGNRAPVCDDPAGPVASLWPANHRMVDLDLADLATVEDPDGDALELSVESVAQDEPVDGLGSGDTAPDATIGEAGAFALRAERSGTGDGRVYEVTYSASDGRGGECAGTLFVEVPHSVQEPAVDSGERHDSTGSP